MVRAYSVTVLDKSEIIGSGAIDAGDILQNLHSSSGGEVDADVNSGGSRAIRFSLRGLDSQRTLVLINGRRAVASGLSANSSVELINIPVPIIERAEVLKDGASAVYGSDALAGVVNIITRSNYEGAEFTTTYGETSQSDGRQVMRELTIGTNSDRGNFVASGYWFEKIPIWAVDRDYSQKVIWLHPYWNLTDRQSGGCSAPSSGN